MVIITISGSPGAGKSTVAKLVAKKLKLKHYSIGDFMRELAAERNIWFPKFTDIAKKDSTIDKTLDERQIKLGKTKDNFVIDSRLGYYFIPNSIKIFLYVNEKESARRLYTLNREGEGYSSIKEALNHIKKRKLAERMRYKKYYNITFPRKGDFDFIINTTKIPAKKIADIIVSIVRNSNLYKPRKITK